MQPTSERAGPGTVWTVCRSPAGGNPIFPIGSDVSPRFVPRSLRCLHSRALEAGATTHQVPSALCHASLATTTGHNAKRESVEGKAVADVLHGSSPDPTVEQILARLPTDERRILLSLIRA